MDGEVNGTNGTRHPATAELAEQHRGFQDRVADRITRFAGSMPFVYLHTVVFVGWIIAGIERFPFGLLTMLVSLEAIFLATFVMISQNRADEKREAIAAVDHENLRLNTELTKAIAEQTAQITQLRTQLANIAADTARLRWGR